MLAVIAFLFSLSFFGVSFYLLDNVGGQAALRKERFRKRVTELRLTPRHFTVEKTNHYSDINSFNQWLTKQNIAKKVNRLIEMTGWKISTGLFLIASAFSAFVLHLLMQARGVPPSYSAAASAIALAIIPPMILKYKRDQYLDKFSNHFPKVLQVIRGSLAAGLGLSIAFERAAKDCPYPINVELTKMLQETAVGKTFVDALIDLKKRVPTPDIQTFVIGVTVQQESGGNLLELMKNLEQTINARVSLRKEMRVLSAQARISGWIITLMTPVLILAIKVLNPDYLTILFETPDGKHILAIMVVLQLLGFAWIKKILDIKITT